MSTFMESFNKLALEFMHQIGYKNCTAISKVDIEQNVGGFETDVTYDSGDAVVIITWFDNDYKPAYYTDNAGNVIGDDEAAIRRGSNIKDNAHSVVYHACTGVHYLLTGCSLPVFIQYLELIDNGGTLDKNQVRAIIDYNKHYGWDK